MHDLMVQTRVLEERLIRMAKQGDGHFWIGGPGEEAFNIPLGLLVDKGEGVFHDYLHLHYRSYGVLLAMGADPVDALRQMNNRATDPYSGGRNFAGHPSVRKWNVVPVSSPIEVQYSMAPGTALAQRRAGGRGITVVTGGDAGTAEGDFATCLVWSSRPGAECPILIVVTNNQWGISTPAAGQHGEKRISDRGRPFGMKTLTVDGNDPETSYRVLKNVMDYIRTERKPVVMETMVSRLYGHSSSSGANFIDNEPDCIALFERRLEEKGLLSKKQADEVRARHAQAFQDAVKRVKDEPAPTAESAFTRVFADENLVGKKRGS